MTVPSATNRSEYTGSGSTATYGYAFKVFSSDQLRVKVKLTSTLVETTLTLTTDYTVTGLGVAAGGNVVLVDADQAWLDGSGFLLSTYTITIDRVMPLTQETSITSQGDYGPEYAEKQFDRSVMIDQQQQREINQSLKLPITETGSAALTTIPNATDRADKVLGFDASGNPTALTVTSVGADSTAPFVTIGNTGTLSAERALTGTANQITVTDNGANSTVVLSTPQNIHTAAIPTFGGEILSAAAAPGGPVTGQIWTDSTQKALTVYQNAMTQKLSGTIFVSTAAGLVENTNAETTIIGAGVGTTTLPANFFMAGKTVRVRCAGNVGTTGAPTCAIRLKYSGSTLATVTLDEATMTLGGSGFEFEFILTCFTAGATGTFGGLAKTYFCDGTVTVTAAEGSVVGIAAAAINTTTSTAIDVTAQWSAASSSNSLTNAMTLVEVLF